MKKKKKVRYIFKGWSLSTIVFLVFLVLKLAQVGIVADMSWWWVTSPLWIPLAIVCGIFTIIVVGGVLAILAAWIFAFLDGKING